VLEGSELFDGYCEAAQPHEQELTPAAFVDLVRSMSHVNSLPAAERIAFIASLRELVDELAPRPLVVPIRTRAVAARRRG
jgi:hypothetical protein